MAAELRSDREQLLGRLVILRDPLLDVISEAQSLLCDPAASVRHVEPPALTPAPQATLGLQSELHQQLGLLVDTLKWTQDVGRSIAVEALGPCYLLSVVIGHPTPQARTLRAKLETARDHLTRFIQR
jgi:hypothetical protein